MGGEGAFDSSSGIVCSKQRLPKQSVVDFSSRLRKAAIFPLRPSCIKSLVGLQVAAPAHIRGMLMRCCAGGCPAEEGRGTSAAAGHTSAGSRRGPFLKGVRRWVPSWRVLPDARGTRAGQRMICY